MEKSKTATLAGNLTKDVTYIISVYVPYGQEGDRFFKLKSMIYPADWAYMDAACPEWLRQREFVTPYDVLAAQVTEAVDAYYAEVDLAESAWEALARYGSRGTVFEEQFRENLEQSRLNTIHVILEKISRGIYFNWDMKELVKQLEQVILSRQKAVERLIDDSYGQLMRYMLLWEYQDLGYTKYKFLTKGETCETCSGLDGRIFDIEAARVGENLAPLHPNCDCYAGILDDTGKVVLLIGESGVYDGEHIPGDEPDSGHWYDGLLHIPRDAKAMIDGIVSAGAERTEHMFDSPLRFLDWLTLGVISANQNRGEVLLDEPNLYNAVNWLTMGAADAVSGAIAPEEPLSLQHWMDSYATVMAGYGAWKSGKAIAGTSKAAADAEIEFNSLDDFIDDPKKFGEITPEQLYRQLREKGYNPVPLSGGNIKGIPFEQGGGFKVNWGGDRILQFHPAGLNHHGGGAYYKLSSGPTGTLRFDLNGNLLTK